MDEALSMFASSEDPKQRGRLRLVYTCLLGLQPRANEPTYGGNSVNEGQMSAQIGLVAISDVTTHQKQGINHQGRRLGWMQFLSTKMKSPAQNG